MNDITLRQVLLVIQRTIDSVDNRLTNHGEQVAFLCLRMGRELGYSEKRLLDLATLAMVHDIGAYKVEEQRRMTEFEVEYPHDHAVYGALFLREFSPLNRLSDVILRHHAKHEDRGRLVGGRAVPDESLLIHLVDRVSVLHAHHGQRLKDAVRREIPRLAGTVFDPHHVSLLLRLVDDTDTLDTLLDGPYLQEIYSYFGEVSLTHEQATAYLSMLAYAIDFRSRQTVTHTVSVVSATGQLSRLLGIPTSDRNLFELAALLHDVGKITTPLEILTKPGRLTNGEMEIMRAHVSVTEGILKGAGLDDVNEIASYHHEKLNGKGYHHGSAETEISIGARIVAIADILAALVEPRYYKVALNKQAVLEIMNASATDGEIDPRIYRFVAPKYDRMVAKMQSKQNAMLALHEKIAAEYECLIQEIYPAKYMRADAGACVRRLAA